jgi:glucan phosphorylase
MEEKRYTETATMSEAKAKVKETTSEVQKKAENVAEEVKQQAQAGLEHIEEEARSSLTTQKTEVVHKLQGVSEALRLTSNQLQGQDQNAFAEYSDKMADQVERVTAYLEEHDLEELRHNAEDFARRQPELFLGGAFTLGLLAARFLKSSAPSGYRQTAVTTTPRSYGRLPETTTTRTRPYTPSG